jgi:CRISPR/Cas system-associated exonuclease Cas4 (RecB family)
MLKGFHCPYGQGDISFADCLEHSKTDPPECGFVHPILAGIANNIRGEMEEITVTQLLNCLRKVVLDRRHDHYTEPQQLYYAFRGQMFHQIAAGIELDGAVVEKRFKRELAGITISGQPDLIVPHLRKLYDFKTAKKVPTKGRVYANHGLQVNIYRWLVLPHHDIDQLELVYMDMSEVKRVPVEVMDVRKLMGWLTPRLKKLKASLDGRGLPPRTGPDGLWQCKGYCSFTERCWPKGVPSAAALKHREEKAREIVMRAVRRKQAEAAITT